MLSYLYKNLYIFISLSLYKNKFVWLYNNKKRLTFKEDDAEAVTQIGDSFGFLPQQLTTFNIDLS